MRRRENVGGVQQAQLNAAHGTAVAVGAKHATAKADCPKCPFGGNDREAAWLCDRLAHTIIRLVNVVHLLADLPQQLHFTLDPAALVQTCRVGDVGGQEVRPKGHRQLVVALVVNREAVAHGVVQRPFNQLYGGGVA